jgi:hypothetical protein
LPPMSWNRGAHRTSGAVTIEVRGVLRDPPLVASVRPRIGCWGTAGARPRYESPSRTSLRLEIVALDTSSL